MRVVAGTADQDRAVHRKLDGRDVIVLADGARGMSGGREAAEFVVEHASSSLDGPDDCVAELRRLDALLPSGKLQDDLSLVLLEPSKRAFVEGRLSD